MKKKPSRLEKLTKTHERYEAEINKFNQSLDEKLNAYIEDYNKHLAYYANFVLLPTENLDNLITGLEKKCVILSEKVTVPFN